MNLGHGRPLYLLPFDHGHSYVSDMFELLVPVTLAGMDRVQANQATYDPRVRPTLMLRAIRALQDAGVEPDVWTVEGLDRREDCERVVATARRDGRRDVDCIVLGRGADEQKVVRWLTVAASVPGFIGCAVGRTPSGMRWPRTWGRGSRSRRRCPGSPGGTASGPRSSSRDGRHEDQSAGRQAGAPRDAGGRPQARRAYYTEVPDPAIPGQRVAFGTSGHRGSSFLKTFNEWHVLAITQAICRYRAQQGIDGPLFLGIDTHALSVPACDSALEVLAANGVDVMLAEHDEYTPTPAVSHAILTHNRGRTAGLADGIVVTPSHNPPEDGGFKYNPPHGGPGGDRRHALDRGGGQRAAGARPPGREANARSSRRCAPPRRIGTTISTPT